jgi:hypothetical protein
MTLRATRLCSTSPTTVTVSPDSAPKCSRTVNRSSSAWVGCWCQPSPALSTWASTKRVRVAAAPDWSWRMTIASTPMACSVSAVSLSDSPLDTLEPETEKFSVSADRRLAASSKLVRVRVESS